MKIQEKVSIKFNAIGNYIGQGYTIAVTIIFTPLYLQYLGAEAYGLLGFFILMQNWLNLLDMGMSTTLCRQVSFARGKQDGFQNFSDLMRSFELVFFLIILSLVFCVYLFKDWLSLNWVKSDNLNPETVSYCIFLMGLIVAIRFLTTLYRGGIIGFEDQIWLNIIVILISSLKYIGSLFILIYVSSDVKLFFQYQLLIALIEVVILSNKFYSSLPSSGKKFTWLNTEWGKFSSTIPFSLGVAYTSGIQIIVSQLDRLLLSGILSLQNFGYFSVILIISNGIIMLSVPIFTAFQPRLTMLAAADSKEKMQSLYVEMTQIVTWAVLSIGVFIVMYSREVLYLLTDNHETYLWGHEILRWYIFGSCIYVVGSCQYYLQHSFGSLKLYVWGMTIGVIVQAPLVYFVTIQYGAVGASKLWFAFSVIWFFAFTFVVHNKFIPNFHLKWLLQKVAPIGIVIGISAILFEYIALIHEDDAKFILFLKLCIISAIFISLTSLSLPIVRRLMLRRFF